jgi:hypothetical protein
MRIDKEVVTPAENSSAFPYQTVAIIAVIWSVIVFLTLVSGVMAAIPQL